MLLLEGCHQLYWLEMSNFDLFAYTHTHCFMDAARHVGVFVLAVPFAKVNICHNGGNCCLCACESDDFGDLKLSDPHS